MNKQIVCIDVGNTTTKFGFFVNGKLRKTLKVINVQNPKLPLLKQENAVVIASVNKQYEKVTLDKFRVDNIYKLGEDIKLNNIPMKFKYEDIETLGKDRICFAFYSYQRFKKNILNISLGTALVIDHIDSNGTFKGGIITAGPILLLESLKRLDGLKKVKFTSVKNRILGNSTNRCISLGIVNSITQLIKFYVEKTNSKHIVISGGNYDIIKPYLHKNFTYTYEPNGIILGLYEIYKVTQK